MTEFHHLHTHTAEGSMLDSILRRKDLIERSGKYVTITEHGSIFRAHSFINNVRDVGKIPVVGMEAYVSPTVEDREIYHLTLLAKNQQGFDNLCKLSTVSYTGQGNFYKKPRVTHENLAELGKGIICLTGCMQSEVAHAVMMDDSLLVHRLIKKYQEWFSDVFIEVMYNSIPEQKVINDCLVKSANRLCIPIVATNDVHYCKECDYDVHEVSLCINTRTNLSNPKRMKFDCNDFWFRTSEQMTELVESKEFMTNTVDICKSIEPYELQRADEQEIDTSHLWDQAKAKVWHLGEDYQKRLTYEYEVCSKQGYLEYFALLSGILDWARDNNILIGPGRGSAAGSLLTYGLGITSVDPLRFPHLSFERFINPDRVSPPDIDIDIPQNKRQELIEYVASKYHIVHIATFLEMKIRAAVQGVASTMEIPYMQTRAFTEKLMTGQFGVDTYEDLNEEQRDELETLITPKGVHCVKMLSGLPKATGKHAAGIILSQHEINLPKMVRKDQVITQLDMHELEDLGYLKYDFLGLNTIDKIHMTLDLLKKNKPDEYASSCYGDIKNISEVWEATPLDDEKTFEFIRAGNLTHIFQMSKPSYVDCVKRLQPENFEHLMALMALRRPGVIATGQDSLYISRRHGAEYEEMHETIDLKSTYGIMLYQENIMKVAQDYAGYTAGQADNLRRIIGKKKIDQIESEGKRFIESAIKNGRNKKHAIDIWEKIKPAGSYAFNAAHSAAYALITYVTAYLNTHFPLEFWSACLSLEDDKDQLRIMVAECPFRFLKPDINKSDISFSTHGDNIMFGLSDIKGVGKAAVEHIMELRPFVSLEDFDDRITKRRCNKRVREALIMSGAFSEFIDREYTYSDEMLTIGIPIVSKDPLRSLKDADKYDDIVDLESKPEKYRFNIAARVTGLHKVKTRKNNNDMAFVNATDCDGNTLRVVIFPYNFRQYQTHLLQAQKDVTCWRFSGIIGSYNGQPSYQMDRMCRIDSIQ